MKLLYAPASPYSAKVRMAARHLGIALEEQVVDTNAAPPELTGPNPLGKIPVLIRKDGGAVFDSRAIMLFLHRESGKKLYPKGEAGTQAHVLEALCDGITDSLLSIVYERRFRPAEMVYQPWIDRQWDKVSRGLAYLEADLPDRHFRTGGDERLSRAAFRRPLGGRSSEARRLAETLRQGFQRLWQAGAARRLIGFQTSRTQKSRGANPGFFVRLRLGADQNLTPRPTLTECSL